MLDSENVAELSDRAKRSMSLLERLQTVIRDAVIESGAPGFSYIKIEMKANELPDVELHLKSVPQAVRY